MFNDVFSSKNGCMYIVMHVVVGKYGNIMPK